MADKNDTPQPVVVVQPGSVVPAPTEGLLQPITPEETKKDPNAKPTYIVNGQEVDPDGNLVKGKK